MKDNQVQMSANIQKGTLSMLGETTTSIQEKWAASEETLARNPTQPNGEDTIRSAKSLLELANKDPEEFAKRINAALPPCKKPET